MDVTADKKQKVQTMFDSIAHRYDFLNHLLSFGVDVYWRRKALRLTGIGNDSTLLDIACGTGDFAREAGKFGPKSIVCTDLSIEMLKILKDKLKQLGGLSLQSICEKLPFRNEQFSNITIAFGVRNFHDLSSALQECNRVLQSNGKLTILEFSLPKNKFVASLYTIYFKNILPLIGNIISKNKSAYTYLPESVEEFDKGIDLVKFSVQAGFNSAEKHILTFGLVQVVIAHKR